jgi:ribose 5-phosphate isomerase B
MKVYFASDHAGFEVKNKLVEYVRNQLKCEVEDCGALVNDPQDDYRESLPLPPENFRKTSLQGKTVVPSLPGLPDRAKQS